MTLQGLSKGTDATPMADLSKSSDLAFVVYCNELASDLSGEPDPIAVKSVLPRIPDVASPDGANWDLVSSVLRMYERSAHLGTRFGRSTAAAEDDSMEKRYADIHELLWQLFVAAQDGKADAFSRVVTVDWITLANGDSSAVDFSRWRF
jgi:hypothetical protein